ncbi:hypothetical protein PPERSA_04599 [Pseudocohnilembus persalinus]|uniref:Uncharacterized protein n=1 Tax=Pseudocohnilembus persalinus TaxID=266149 RepID=A0A0V0QNS1_PSEPJ|nr:hypothetical protein PPERSA_04599 [Pseudocohnilembus persalinus]|eukprot:KRX03804.1 hypothetical protein PPERSA_04599 [Pseudocohnilembus persalinus]
MDFKNRLQNQVNEIYEELENKLIIQLNLSKKSILQQFEEIMDTIQISDIYGFQKLKQSFQKLQMGQTDLDQLFKIQLDVKNKLQNKKNSEIILNHQKIREQLKESINNLENKLEEKLNHFKQNIQLESEALNEIKLKNLKFFKSNYNQELNIQQDIQIQQININNQTKFLFHDKIIQKNKQIYSEPLDKTKTYQFKLKIDLQGQNKQQILFVLLGSQDKDYCWQKQNIITLTNRSGATFASNGKKETKNGLRFSKFMKDNQTIFYLVFNFKKKFFELFDEQKKGYVKSEIDENLVKGDLLFGLHFHQMYQNTGVFTLLNAEFI